MPAFCNKCPFSQPSYEACLGYILQLLIYPDTCLLQAPQCRGACRRAPTNACMLVQADVQICLHLSKARILTYLLGCRYPRARANRRHSRRHGLYGRLLDRLLQCRVPSLSPESPVTMAERACRYCQECLAFWSMQGAVQLAQLQQHSTCPSLFNHSAV